MVKLNENGDGKMKKLIGILMMVVVFLLVGPANGAIVNTTFEVDSNGTGTWPAGKWDDNVDPASGVAWQTNSDSRLKVVKEPYYDAAVGDQCGRASGATDNSGSYMAELIIGSGNYTGQYTVTAYGLLKDSDTAPKDDAHGFLSATDADVGYWGGARIALHYLTNGSHVIRGRTYQSGYVDVDIISISLDTWYELKMEVDTVTHKVKYAARPMSGTWTETNLYGCNASLDSIDKIGVVTQGYASGVCTVTRWDDIQMIPEPATMSLLLLGLPLAIRRRR